MNKLYSGLAMLVVGLSSLSGWAADHRESALIREDPSADIADVYAFRNPDNADNLVLVMTVNPFSAPAENISYHFSPGVRYRFNIDNDGNAVADRTIDLTFGSSVQQPQPFTALFPGNILVRGTATPPTDEPEQVPIIINSGPQGIRIFAGQREDPFFFDLVGFLRTLAGGEDRFSGTDSFAGFNVSAIVVELPLTLVTEGSTQLQIWGETDRTRQTLRSTSAPFQRNVGTWVQVERMGNPVVNTVFIPFAQRDFFNAQRPSGDAQFADEILARLDQFGTSDANIQTLASVALPDTLKLNLSNTDGFPNGRRLDDDVIDTLLTLIFQGTGGPTTDRVNANDRPFPGEFPYLAEPFLPPAE